MDRVDDLKAKSLGKVGPSRMMCDETPVREAFSALHQLLLDVCKSLQIGVLICLKIGCMNRINVDEGSGDVAQHDADIHGIQPNMWISSRFGAMRARMALFVDLPIVRKKLDVLGCCDDA